MADALPDWMVFEDENTFDLDDELPGYEFYDKTIKIHFDSSAHVYFRYDEEGVRHDIDGVTTVLGIINKPFLVPWATKLCIETLQGYLINKDTGALNAYTTEELLMWMHEAKNKHRERLETAGDIGHIAHDCLEHSIQYAIDHTNGVVLELKEVPSEPTPQHDMARNCANAAWDWMKKHNVRWIATERKIYSRTYDFAGTEDGICLVDSCDDLECCRGRVFKDRKAISDWKSSNQLSDSYGLQVAAYQFAQIEEFGEFIPDRWVLRLGKEDGKFEPWYLSSEEFEADLEAFLAALQLYRSMAAISERRKADRAARRAIINARKKAVREARLEQERLDRLAAREASKKATKARQEAAKADYKMYRAKGFSPDEAKALAYPKAQKPVPSEPLGSEQVAVQEAPFEVEWTLNL